MTKDTDPDATAGAGGNQTAGKDSPMAVALEHAIRRWSAEEENARRVSQRANTLVTLIVALLGLGLFRIGSEGTSLRLGPAWLAVTVRACMTVGLGLVGWSLVVVLQASPGAFPTFLFRKAGEADEPMASSHLAWPENLGTESNLWAEMSAEEARAIATSRTAKAAHELYALNHEKDTYVVNGQALLLWAGLFLGVALTLSF